MTKDWTFENVGLDAVGSARKVIVGKDNTTIIEGAGKESAVKSRIAQIVAQAENASSEYDKEQYENEVLHFRARLLLSKLAAQPRPKSREKKFRVDDAVAATKAALAEGIVAGGGVTLVNLAATITAGSDSVSAGLRS